MADDPPGERPVDRTESRTAEVREPPTASGSAVDERRAPTRRRVLGMCGAAAAAVVAGCADDGGEPTDTDEGSDGSGSDGAAGGDDGETAGDSADASGTDDSETAGDGGATGDDTETDASVAETTEPQGEPTETPAVTETEAATETTESQPQLREAAEFTNSFEMEMTWHRERQFDMSGRFHEGDLYWRWEAKGQVAEVYFVDGNSYFVADGVCWTGTQNIDFDAEDVNPKNFEERAEENPNVEPAGTDEIDGKTVYVYEFETGSAQGRYYILADSGYLRRVETAEATWDFHSWGEASAVEKPDIECQDPSTR